MTQITGKTLAFFATVIGLLERGHTTSCPAGETITPCICKEAAAGLLDFECQDFSIQSIYRALDTISSMRFKVNAITIGNPSTMSLRPRLLGYSTVKSVVLKMPNLRSLNYYAFEYQSTSIERLSILSSSMSSIPSYAIQKLTELATFEVSVSPEIRVVESDLFRPLQNPSSIRIVKFIRNSIETVEKNAFGELLSVREINLKRNKLKSLRLDALPPNVQDMEKLVFWSNKFESIPENIVSKMGQDSTLDLYDNKIVNVTSDVLATILQKHITVHIGGNRLYCGCSFAVIAKANKRGRQMSIESGTCDGPPILNGTDLDLLEENYFKMVCGDSYYRGNAIIKK